MEQAHHGDESSVGTLDCDFAVVVLEDPTESLSALDSNLTVTLSDNAAIDSRLPCVAQL